MSKPTPQKSKSKQTTETGKAFELQFLSEFMEYMREEYMREPPKKHYDIFIPFIDNNGIDFVIRTDNGETYKEIQVKGREPRNIFTLKTELKEHRDYWLILYCKNKKENKYDRYILSQDDLKDKGNITSTGKVSKKLLTEARKERDFDDIFK